VGTIVAATGTAMIGSFFALRAQADQSSTNSASSPGEVGAAAAVLGAVPQASSLSLTVSAGQSDAAYNQTEDQATSGSVDMGGLGVLLANSPVCGSVFFTQSRQPPVTTADSADYPSGGGTKTNNTDGAETVTVSTRPEFARATTAPVAQSLPGVISITGQSQTDVRYVTGQEQEATATVTADVTLAGGLVTMQGATWTAALETGVTNTSTATFDPGTVVLAPARVPITLPKSDSTAQVLAAINAVLSTVGLTVTYPQATSDSNTGSLTITPLDLHFVGSPTDNKLLSPIAPQIGTLEDVVAGQSADGSDCSQVKNLLGNLLTPSEEVLNLLLAGAQGSGGVNLDVGGASVFTQAAPDFSDPFGSGFSNPLAATPLPVAPVAGVNPTTGNPIPTAPSGSQQVSSLPAGSPAVSAPAASPATSPTAHAATAGASSSSSPGLIRCVTTSPAGSPSCWDGLGVVAGAVTVVVGGGLLAADLVPGLVPAGMAGRRSRRSNKRRRK
jgi:hypothetical protein